MTGFDSAYEQVKILVEHFSANEKMYLAAEYSEARVRTDFIDKFFTALGWDVNHNEQLNPYEQEVSIEKPVKVEGMQQKRADYAFFLAPNYRKDDVKFYVEAKKPARNLSNQVDYFQTCRYGWSAGTPLAILTDFEEFHILDCRTKPEIDTILDTKREYFHYKDYLDKEKFAKVYWLFSREAVANNSIEKYVEQLPKLRGKGVQKKRGYESIDEVFLEELDEIRTVLAKAFKKNNPHLGSDELTEMTQRTIDRLVFIRFLEDKQIEPEHYISEFGGSKTAWRDFIYASRKLDAKYNGIVFKKTFIDEKNFVEPNDSDFAPVCKELSHVNSPYNFDLIPIHILGSIYERFLGKVVVATDKRVRIDEKPEVRKAGGVYYTPQYIVNYVVENTIGKLIDGKTPKEIAKLRFADISCGSGSFLITVFDKLLEYHKRFYQNNPKEAKSAGCYEVNGKWVLSLKQKQKILTNNIYGVDIDAQAVEVTQLSLYLKLLEDESNATAEETWVMFKEQILPSLSDNIICGNSLIGTDISSGTLFNWEEEKKLKPMNFEDAFPKIMKEGGFDAVVGNPPYEITLGKEKKENVDEIIYLNNYFKRKFSHSGGEINLYKLFTERASLLTKNTGYFSYIMPTSLLNDKSNQKLREHLFTIFLGIEINQFPESSRVFKEVTQDVSIYIFTNNFSNICLRTGLTKESISLSRNIILDKALLSKIDFKIPLVKNEKEFNLLIKLLSFNRLLDFAEFIKIAEGEIHLTKFKAALRKIKNNVCDVKLIRGDVVQRYQLLNNTIKESWIDSSEVIKISDSPKLQDAKLKRLVYQQVVNIQKEIRLNFTLLQDSCYLGNTCGYVIVKGIFSLELLLALFNSKLMNWRFKLSSSNNHILTNDLYNLPLAPKEVLLLKSDKIVDMSNQMLNHKKQLATAKTDNEKEYLEKKCKGLDRQIDALVYELYGLTEEEIKIVEG
ncbi:MAG: N-6 DNA methylase [Ignavibacteriaceae bacterium]|jgi:Alw26I/Eco31I/Esp3I family type II restriction m6 adenine DNA methyltransferase|nr:N-6 DNA methylase [Ignavibacteriaceae bacterium]